jgi:predicted DNA-binding protein
MVRTQLFLDEAIHERLRSLARKQGRTVSALVREVLERVFGNRAQDERERTLKAIEGLWRGRSDIGATREYVRGLRRSTRSRSSRQR